MVHIKLDENLDPRWREPLELAGHRVSTVVEEGLGGATDAQIAEACRGEKLCLVTADLDFAQTIEYPPGDYDGLVVLRHNKPTLAGMMSLVSQVAQALKTEPVAGKLWIVEPGRIRIRD